MGGCAKSDIVCFIIAIGGILLWQTTNNPALALYASIAADFPGMIPALIKTYRYPQTEVWSFFALDVLASGFSLMAVNSWTLQEFSYPLYTLIINAVMVMFILRPQLSKYFKA